MLLETVTPPGPWLPGPWLQRRTSVISVMVESLNSNQRLSPNSQCRCFQNADTPSPSPLKRLLKGEGGAAERQCRHWLLSPKLLT